MTDVICGANIIRMANNIVDTHNVTHCYVYDDINSDSFG